VACAQVPVKPDYVSESFEPSKIDRIVILPVADIRVDRSVRLNPQHITYSMITYGAGFTGVLKEKGYDPIVVNEFGDIAPITMDDISEVDPQWLKKRGPSDSRWI
jgi:hypothetical protein